MDTLRLVLDVIGALAVLVVAGFSAAELRFSWRARRARRERKRERETGAARKDGWMPW